MILPEMLNFKKFVNANEITKELSPFHPESAEIQTERFMLRAITLCYGVCKKPHQVIISP